MIKQFNVKEESAKQFFLERGIKEALGRSFHQEDTSVYHLMRDEIFLKKSNDLEVGQTVVFELHDISRYSQEKLINTYKYSVSEYDDVCFKLTLLDFEIKAL